jgi:O-antigen ligase
VILNLLILAGFGAVGFVKIKTVLLRNRLILLGLILTVVSALWSATPLLTLRMSVELILSTGFTCYLAARFQPERLMNLLLMFGLIAALFSIILVLFMPKYGLFHGYGSGAWQGICNHKNSLGIAMAFLLTPVFFVQKPFLLKACYSALLLFMVAMSQSRGAWLETLGTLAFVVWLFAFRKCQGKESVVLLMVTAAAVTVIVILGIWYLGPITRMLGKDPTLTGRTGIYTTVFDSILRSPILGYGYGAFWKFDPESFRIAIRLKWMNIGYAENGFLELALQLGIVGVLVVLAMFIKAIRQSIFLIRSGLYTPRIGWYLTIIVLDLLTNIDSGWLMVSHTLDWSLTMVACIGLANEVRRIQPQVKGTMSKPVGFRQAFSEPATVLAAQQSLSQTNA